MSPLPGLLVAGLLWAAQPAPAAPVTYHCQDRWSFTANFTPQRAQVTLRDVQMDLVRVPSAGRARYENRKLGVSLVTAKREAVLKVGSSELRCEFTIVP